MTSVQTLFSMSDIYNSLPILILAGGGLVLMILEAFSRFQLVGKDTHLPAETSEAYSIATPGSRFYFMPLAAFCLLVALFFVGWQWLNVKSGSVSVYQGMLTIDRTGLLMSGICIIAGFFSILGAPSFLQSKQFEFGEYYALVLFSCSGMLILNLASDWVALFLGIETLSLAVYILTGSWRRSARSSEAAMKYFLMGSFVSAILLFGIALLYGVTGTTHLTSLKSSLLPSFSASTVQSTLLSIGALLILLSFAFKVALVPFHMWAPDAYEGAPSPVTGFMMAAVKTAGFTALARVAILLFANEPLRSQTLSILYGLCGITMLVGNFAALRQQNIKRMLAYSSIAHAGYALLSILLLDSEKFRTESMASLFYYLLSYSVSAIGAMTVISWVSGSHLKEEKTMLSDWVGLGKRQPAAALAMTIFLLSLGGIPPTAGFFGKFYLFRLAFQETTLWPLAFLAIGTSLLSMAYYLKVIMAMYFKHSPQEVPVEKPAHFTAMGVAIFCLAILSLGMGIFSKWFWNLGLILP